MKFYKFFLLSFLTFFYLIHKILLAEEINLNELDKRIEKISEFSGKDF